MKIDEGKMRAWVDGQVKNAVEDVLNDIMEAEAEALAGAETKSVDIINGFFTFTV